MIINNNIWYLKNKLNKLNNKLNEHIKSVEIIKFEISDTENKIKDAELDFYNNL